MQGNFISTEKLDKKNGKLFLFYVLPLARTLSKGADVKILISKKNDSLVQDFNFLDSTKRNQVIVDAAAFNRTKKNALNNSNDG